MSFYKEHKQTCLTITFVEIIIIIIYVLLASKFASLTEIWDNSLLRTLENFTIVGSIEAALQNPI